MARGRLGFQQTQGCAERIAPRVLKTLMGARKEVLFSCIELSVCGDKEILFRSAGLLWKLLQAQLSLPVDALSSHACARNIMGPQ